YDLFHAIKAPFHETAGSRGRTVSDQELPINLSFRRTQVKSNILAIFLNKKLDILNSIGYKYDINFYCLLKYNHSIDTEQLLFF
ncbi:hypothetical protein EZS27_014615, partial [termite gut metagenome]